MRQLILAVALLVSISSTFAEDPPIVVIRVASLAELESDRQALEEIGGSLARRADPVHELFHVAGIPRGPWLDRDRPLWAILTQSRLMADRDRFVGLLPVMDLETALREMGVAQGDPDDDGIVAYLRDDETTLYVRSDRHYITVGASRDGVKAVDRGLLEATVFPPGTFAIEVDLRPLTPMAELAFAGQRQAMQRQMEQAREQMQQSGNPTEELEASRTMALKSMTFGQEMLLGLMRNVSHAQLAVERKQAEVLFHLHVLPLGSSDLESIVEAQPTGFPRLARAIPEVDTSVKGVTNIEYTEELQEALSFLTDFYGSAIGGWAGLVGGDMDWLSTMFDDQMDFSRDRMRCMRGDSAFVNDFGSRAITVHGTRSGAGCDEIQRRQLEKMRGMLGPGGEPLMQVTEPSMIYQGASVARTELRTEVLEQLVGGEEQESLRAMLDQLGAATSSLHAEIDGVAVTAAGDSSDEDFKATVDRLSARSKKGGLTPADFLPFEAGGGVYISLTTPPGGFAAIFSGGAQADGEGGNRMVFALRATDGRLALGAALPLSMFEGLMQQDEAQAAAGVPSDFWPPPRERDAAIRDAASEAETQDETPVIAGEDGVTVPVLIERVDPEYPEWLRVSSLEGRVVLQATVRKNGKPRDLAMLNCWGRARTDKEMRGNLSRESDFCQAMYVEAAAAVEQWRYEPATKDGEAVDAYFTVIVRFSLD